ncbi:NCAM [Mytilus coruscus]|uniref:NCAM n=1 Tax=Mytilus coruscus TaxID=42192 RepID=A0A6J8DTT9_MYTCO|nr:NCAM [Mytilus coruscus]
MQLSRFSSTSGSDQCNSDVLFKQNVQFLTQHQHVIYSQPSLQVVIINISGLKLEISPITLDTNGEIINPAIPNMNRLKVVGNITKGDYNLQIQNVSSSDEGIYKCSQRVTGISVKEHRIVLKLKVKPKNDKILHSENGVIKGEEGKVLNLTCSVESGIPLETITLYNVSSRLKCGGPGILTIRIKTTIFFYHAKMYSCKVEADTLLTPIQKNITLDIKNKPFVSFNTSNPIIVTENNNMTLLCYSHGNPLVEEMQIENGKKLALTYRRHSTCKFTIFKIKQADAGLYKCNARSAIGPADTAVKVNVTYPPSFAVTQDIRRAELQCNPDGNSPKYTF